jgi:hypothetical protein
MKKYKYYSKLDSKKETIGIVKANSPDGARAKASEKKQLAFLEFTKLFNVEEIQNEG